jgi:hypothetical protein
MGTTKQSEQLIWAEHSHLNMVPAGEPAQVAYTKAPNIATRTNSVDAGRRKGERRG